MSHILLIQLNLPSSMKTADKLLSIIRNSGNIVPRSLFLSKLPKNEIEWRDIDIRPGGEH